MESTPVSLRSTALALFVSVILVGATPSAWAGGAEWPANGAKASGRAGAFTAKADDPSALVHNPAGLAQVKGYQMFLSSSFVKQGLCVDRSGNYPGTPAPYSFAGQPYPEVCRSEKGLFAIPMFALSFDFGLEDWTFAIGGAGPHAVGTRSFPTQVTVLDPDGRPVRAPGPARYDVVSTSVTVIFFMLGAAYRAAKWLDLGLTVEAQLQTLDYQTTISLNPSLDPDGDARFGVSPTGWAATGKLAALIHPVPGLHIGLSVRLPVKTHAQGDATVRLPASFAAFSDTLQFHDGKKQVELDSTLPLIVRGGIRYAWRMKNAAADAPELADVELDIVYERWRAFRSLDTKLNADFLGSALEKIPVGHFYNDTGELRLGGSFTIPKSLGGGWLTLRAGWSYVGDGSPLEYTRIDFAAWARMGLYFGLGFRIWGMELNLALSYLWNGTGKSWQPWTFKSTREVAASCVRPIDPLSSGPVGLSRCDPSVTPPNPSADLSAGTWRGSYLNFAASLTIRFDELARRIKHSKQKRPAIGGPPRTQRIDR